MHQFFVCPRTVLVVLESFLWAGGFFAICLVDAQFSTKLATSPVCISFHPKIVAMSCGQVDAADGFTLRRVPKKARPTGGVGVAEVHVGPAPQVVTVRVDYHDHHGWVASML